MQAAQIVSDDLYPNMTRALSLIGMLTDISKQKEAFLTNGDIEGLRNATEKEEELIAALNRTEKDRRICADALSQAIGLFNEDITLKDIVEKITDKEMRERLSALRDKLIEAAAQLSARNDRLAQLLQLQIGFTDYMINMQFRPKSRNNSYDIQGSRREDTSNRSMLDLHI